MKKICLIGNYSIGKEVSDGQRCKVRLYYDILLEEGFAVSLIDLARIKRHPFSTLIAIKNGIKKNDVIVLITANRGANYLIPFVNLINKKYKKRFVLPLVGTSVLHNTIDKLKPKQAVDFILNKNFSLKKPSKRLIKNLKSIDLVLPETDRISNIFREYYGLSNVCTLTNFRKDTCFEKKVKPNSAVFLSRVMKQKGIFDLISAFKSVKGWTLDIYGPIDLSKEELSIFNFELSNNSNINYCGIVRPSNAIDTIAKYSLFVFPTRFVSEGTPGAIIESLIAQTPILTSSFLQADEILVNHVDSLFYSLGDSNDLCLKLEDITSNISLLKTISSGVKNSGKKYQYSYNRSNFLKFIVGD